MAKKKKSAIEPIQENETTMFEVALQMVKEMKSEQKKEFVRLFFLLVACEEDGKLNMDRVRELLGQASDGNFKFDQ